MDLSQYKSISIDGIEMKKLEINGIQIWERYTYTNWVPLSINADGTIYNDGLGYKNGYRVRSGGTEVEYSSTCTGFIPVSGGDIVRISGCNFSNAQNGNAINVSDSSFTNIGQLTTLPANYGIFYASGGAYKEYGSASVVQESESVWKWVVPPDESGVAYIRVTAYSGNNTLPGASLIVTINEEIE